MGESHIYAHKGPVGCWVDLCGCDLFQRILHKFDHAGGCG